MADTSPRVPTPADDRSCGAATPADDAQPSRSSRAPRPADDAHPSSSSRAATPADDARHSSPPQPDSRMADVAAALKPRLRGVLHEAAFAISLVTGTALICLAHGTRERVAAVVYASSVALLFGTSAAYHRGTWSVRGNSVMSRLDHSMIFVLIAGSYTPFGLLLLHGTLQVVVLAVVWGGALAGVLVRNALQSPPRWVFVGLYLGLGWVALGIIPDVLRHGGVAVLVLLLAGGVCYSVGALVYGLRRPNPSPDWFGFHEVFHACTLLAFALHYVAVSLTTYRS